MAGTLAENDWPAPRSDGEFHCFDLSCPSLTCSKNKLSGLLRHVRESHLPSDVPSWFVRKWRHQACPSCHFFFKELSKHTKCGGKTSVQRQALASASAEGGDNVAACALVVANASVGVAVGDSASVAASAAVGVAASDGVVAGGAPVAPGEQLSGRDTGVGADGAFAERESWGLVEGLSWDDILQRCPSTVLGIKDHLKAVWQQAMMIPLRALSANIADEGAWKLLFLLPSMLLARDAQRGGKKGSGEIKRKFKRFLAYQWAPLLVSKDGRRVNHSDSSPEAVRQGILKKVESCVREGDISRAARLLTSSGLAPDSAETLQRLKAKHPQSSVPLSSPCDDSAGPITLERESFLKALKSTPRGSAPGPSGLRFEHLKVCSEVRDLCDCLCGIVQKVAAGGPALLWAELWPLHASSLWPRVGETCGPSPLVKFCDVWWPGQSASRRGLPWRTSFPPCSMGWPHQVAWIRWFIRSRLVWRRTAIGGFSSVIYGMRSTLSRDRPSSTRLCSFFHPSCRSHGFSMVNPLLSSIGVVSLPRCSCPVRESIKAIRWVLFTSVLPSMPCFNVFRRVMGTSQCLRTLMMSIFLESLTT